MSDLDAALATKISALAEMGLEISEVPENLNEAEKADFLEQLDDLLDMVADGGGALEQQPATLERIETLMADILPANLSLDLSPLNALESNRLATSGLYEAYNLLVETHNLAMTVPGNEEGAELVRLANAALTLHGLKPITEADAKPVEDLADQSLSPDDYTEALWPAFLTMLANHGLGILELTPMDGAWSVHAFIFMPIDKMEAWDLRVFGDYVLQDWR